MPLQPRTPRAGRGDDGAATAALLRTAAVLAVLAVAGFDALSVGASRLAVSDQAGAAARSAADVWATGHDVRAAFEAAATTAQEADPGNVVDPRTFTVTPQGTVDLDVRRTAHTFALARVAPHVGTVQHWVEVSAHGHASAG